MRTTVENLYKNASYSQYELISILAFGFIIGFLFAFDNWGVGGLYNKSVGIQNLLLYSIACIFVLFVFTYVQKVIGVLVGVHASHQISWVYLVISILLCFLSAGKIVVFIPPTLHIRQLEHLSIGRKPFAFSIKNLRIFALLPLLALVTTAVIISELLPVSGAAASTIFWVSFLTVLYSLIPIEFLVSLPTVFARGKVEMFSPSLAHNVETKGISLGSILLYGSKMNFIFALIFLICSLISQVTTGVLFTILFSFLVALSMTTIYFVKTEID